VEIEDISWVSLSSWRSSEQKGHLSVGDGLLGKIVIDDKSMFAVISEVLCDGASGVGCQELKRSGFGGSGGDDDGVFKGVMELEGVHDVGNSGSLLSNCDVDAEQLLMHVSGVEVGLLVDNGIDSDGGLSSLSVSDDQLSLSSTDGHQPINGLQSGLHRLVHRFSGDNSRSLDLYSLPLGGFDWTEAVDGVTEGIENAT